MIGYLSTVAALAHKCPHSKLPARSLGHGIDLVAALAVCERSLLRGPEVPLSSVEHGEDFEAGTEDDERSKGADRTNTVVVEVTSEATMKGRRIPIPKISVDL